MPDPSLSVQDIRIQMNEDQIAAFFSSAAGPFAKAMLGYGLQVERAAKRYCPVDTGRLRSSITTILVEGDESLEVWVGTNVDYAVYVEFGTRFMEPQSFLRRALAEVLK